MFELLAAQGEDRGVQVHVLLVPHQGHDLLGQELERVDCHVVPEMRGEGFCNLLFVVADAHGIRGQRADIGEDLLFHLLRTHFVAMVPEERELLDPGEEDPVRDRVRRFVLHPVRVHLPVLEVVPEIKDLEILLLPFRQPCRMFAGAVGPGPPPEHLPELDLREDRFCKDKVADLRHIDPRIQHIHRDRNPGHRFLLEGFDQLVRPGVLRYDGPGKRALVLGIERIECFLQPVRVLLRDRKEDRLRRQRPGLVHEGILHELADDRLRCPFHRHLLLQLRTLEIDLVRIDSLLQQPCPLAFRQILPPHPGDLEMRLGAKDALPEIHQYPVPYRIIVRI